MEEFNEPNSIVYILISGLFRCLYFFEDKIEEKNINILKIIEEERVNILFFFLKKNID